MIYSRCLLVGLAAALLSAIPSVGQVAPPPRPDEGPGGYEPDDAVRRQILAALRDGRSKEALTLANQTLRSFPDSIWLNCAAGETAVVDKDRQSLSLVLHRLQAMPSTESKECVAKLDGQYRKLVLGSDLRKKALDLIRRGKVEEARQAVAAAHLDAYETLTIDFYLDRAQTRFSSALSALPKLSSLKPSTQYDALFQETRTQAKEFSDLAARARAYLYDPLATSQCRADTAKAMFEQKGWSLSDFVATASALVREYPSHPEVQQFYFLALVFGGADESVKRYGNLILNQNGVLRVPFFSRDSLYFLEINRRQKRLSLKQNPSHKQNLGRVDGLRPAEPFDLSYPEILSLHQPVSSDLHTLSLSEKSAAVDLGLQGVAPYYSLMTIVHCLYGEKFERAATERLGRFLAGEIGLPADRAKLVDPNGTTHDVLGAVVTSAAIATMVASQVAITHQQQLPVQDPNVQITVALQQLQVQQVQDSGMDVLAQQAEELARRQEVNDSQAEETASLEQSLAEQGFDRALDPDIPGYLITLAKMLRSQN